MDNKKPRVNKISPLESENQKVKQKLEDVSALYMKNKEPLPPVTLEVESKDVKPSPKTTRKGRIWFYMKIEVNGTEL